MNEEMMMKMKLIRKHVMMSFLMSITFSIFGMLLIFGLGFVFPTINPYIVIKWIVIVCAVVFAYSFVTFAVLKVMHIKMLMAKRGIKTKRSSK
jgi:hypothetical protein